MSANEDLVELGDMDELVRHVDRLCRAEVWDELVDLRDRCRAAVERGRQLWPVASLCEYRLALHAPGELAGPVVVEGAGRFGPGPLAEVAASSHSWGELAPHLEDGPLRSVVAHECAVRGGDLATVVVDERVVDLALVLADWEPAYALATYTNDGASVEEPDLPEPAPIDLPAAGEKIADAETSRVFRNLVRPWTADSDGQAAFAAIEGGAEAAIAVLAPRRARAAPLTLQEAMAYLAWTGASGGAHGQRRGAAAGRATAWFLLATLTGLDEDWPVSADELGGAGQELRFLRWDDGGPEIGWRFHLAIEDPVDGLAWAMAATDRRESQPEEPGAAGTPGQG